MFESPADEHINGLIEHLCDKASHPFVKEAERQKFIDQIAQLRAAQNPIVNMIRQ